MIRPAAALLALSLCAAAPLHTQAVDTLPVPDSARVEAARALMAAMKTTESFIENAERGMEVMRRSAADRLPPEFYERVSEELRRSAPQLLEQMAMVYARHLRKEELEGLTAFYLTPLGQTLAAKQGVMSVEAMQIGVRWGQEVAQKALADLPHQGTPPSLRTTEQ